MKRCSRAQTAVNGKAPQVAMSLDLDVVRWLEADGEGANSLRKLRLVELLVSFSQLS